MTDNDKNIQERMMNIWKQWHQSSSGGGSDDDEAAPLLWAQISLPDICNRAHLHHGTRKALCELRDHKGIAFVARYISLGTKDPTREIQKELKSLERLRAIGIPVMPFLNKLITFHCSANNHHPGVPKNWRRRIASIPQRICGGFLMQYMEGPEHMLLSPTSMYKVIRGYTEGSSNRYHRSWRALVRELGKMPRSAAQNLVNTMRTLHERLVQQNAHIHRLQGIVNIHTGAFHVIDTKVSIGHSTPVTPTSDPAVRHGLFFAKWLARIHKLEANDAGEVKKKEDGNNDDDNNDEYSTSTSTNKRKREFFVIDKGHDDDDDDDNDDDDDQQQQQKLAATMLGRVYTEDGYDGHSDDDNQWYGPGYSFVTAAPTGGNENNVLLL